MTTVEKDAALKLRGCDIIEDRGDFALVYPYGINSKRAHDLAAKTREEAIVESWDWLNPDQQVAERIEIIQRVIASAHGTTAEELIGGGRPEPLATARRIAMAIARQLTPASTFRIGDTFLRDHGTVIYAEKTIAEQCESDERFAARFGALRELCKATIAQTREKKANAA